MDLTKESSQRREFCNILLGLAKDQELLQDKQSKAEIYERLETLYGAESKEKHFRHFYSDIFFVLTQIQQNPYLGDIDTLGQNLDVIRKGYKPQNTTSDGKRIIDISDAIKKLSDHVSLEIARITYSDNADRNISGESSIVALRSQVTAVETKIQKSQKDLDKVNDKLDNSQKEYIAILGIFAAVVLAFTGGIAFSTSILNNIAKASMYRTVIIALIIGLILINVLFGLFYYVNSLVNKDKKMFPLVISNIVIAILLAVTFFAWKIGYIEKRNHRIEQEQSITETIPEIENPSSE